MNKSDVEDKFVPLWDRFEDLEVHVCKMIKRLEDKVDTLSEKVDGLEKQVELNKCEYLTMISDAKETLRRESEDWGNEMMTHIIDELGVKKADDIEKLESEYLDGQIASLQALTLKQVKRLESLISVNTATLSHLAEALQNVKDNMSEYNEVMQAFRLSTH